MSKVSATTLLFSDSSHSATARFSSAERPRRTSIGRRSKASIYSRGARAEYPQ